MDELQQQPIVPEGDVVVAPEVKEEVAKPAVEAAPSPDAAQPVANSQVEAQPIAPVPDDALLKGLETAAPLPVQEKRSPVVSTAVQQLTPYLGAGKDTSHLSGMQDVLADRLSRLVNEAPPSVREGFKINSGYRSNERQAQIFKEAVAKYGSEEAARKWAAPPGKSNHNHGNAADIGFQTEEARAYFHANAARYDLAFPMAHEPWHIETREARMKRPVVDVPGHIRGYIDEAVERSGTPLNVMLAIGKQESDFGRNLKNTSSSAKGIYQFIDGTWTQMVSSSAAIYGLPTTVKVDDERANVLMAGEYMRQNKIAFEKALQRPQKDGEMYISHFMGTQGGIDFVKAWEQNPGQNAAAAFPKAANANKTIFYNDNGTPRSMAQVYSKLSAYVDGNTDYKTSTGPANFAAPVAPANMLPARPASTQKETMDMNEAMAKREAEMPWYQGVADAVSQNSITARILQQNPHFTPDSSFVLTPQTQQQLQKDYQLTPDMMPRLEKAVSANHAEYIAAQAQRDQQAQEHLSNMGWSGAGLSLATALLDPVALGVGIGSGGLADVAAVAMGAGRVGRMAMQAGAGAGANVGLEMAERATGGPEGHSLLMTAAMGAMFGGAYGLLSRNPATLEEARKLANLGKSMKDDLQNGTSLSSGNLGAAGNPNATEAFLNDKAFIATQDKDVAYTVNSIMGVKTGRFDSVGQLKSVKDPNTRLVGGALGEDAVGNADHSLNSFSATEDMERMHRADLAQLNQMWAPAASEWAKDNGFRLGRLTGGAEFNDLVTSYIRNTDKTLEWHPAVKRLGDHIAAMNREKLLDAQNPLRREGMVGRPLKGWEEIPENPNYMMRIYDGFKVNQLIDDSLENAIGQRGLETWFKNAMRKAQTWMDEELLDKIAVGTVKRLRNKANGIDEAMNMMHSGFDLDHLKSILVEEGMDEKRLEQVLGTVRLNTERGVDARARHRILLDETHVERGYRTINGQTRDIALSDFTVTDAKQLSDIYFRHMNGRIALARVRIQNPTTGEMLVNGITSDTEWATLRTKLRQSMLDSGMSRGELDKATANLDFLYDRTLGRPDPGQNGQWADWLRRVRKYNFVRQAGGFGLAQLPEMAMIPAQLGVKAFMQHMPAFKRIVTTDGRTILKDGLAAEWEAAFGNGTDRMRGMQFFKNEELGYHSQGAMGKLDNALDFAQNAVAEASGMTTINTMLQRTTAKVITQKFADMALDASQINMKRMASLGLSDAMLKRILAQTKHFTKEDGILFDGKVTKMNLDKWDDMGARAAFENSVFRWSRRIIQENDIGNMHRWASGPLWQMLFQFRTFSINSWNKQFMLNMHMKDMTSFHVMTFSLLAGAGAYAMRTQINAVGRSDREDFLAKRLSPEKLAAGAFQNTGWSSLIPMGIDTAGYLTGNSPVFDARTSGNASDIIFGSPTVGFIDDISKAAKGVVQPMKDGRERSQFEYRNIAAVAPLKNWAPWQGLLSSMISGAPERPPR
jgi:LAS superfamily LD-carboxypeptidase LdcB